jgi:hypothetical protein
MARLSTPTPCRMVAPFGLSRRPAQRRASVLTPLAALPCHARAARRARGAERQRAHSRSERQRVRAVSARLEAVQKVLTNSSQTAMSDCNGRGAMSLPRDRITASTAHDARIRPHRGNTRVQSPARRLQRVTNIGDLVPPLISQCPRRTRGLLPPSHHHGWRSRISGFRTQGTV